MRKILVLLLVLLSLTACTQQSTTTKDLKVFTGTEGIVMNFIPNMPPSQIYSSDQLNFLIEVKNKGAYATVGSRTEGLTLRVYLSGFDKDIFPELYGLDDDVNGNYIEEDSLEGKSEFNPDGGLKYIEKSTSINLPSGLDSFKTNFLVTTCYEYQTYATASVCIDPKPYSTAIKEKACTVQDITLSGGQGAPVVITKIEEEASKDKVRFKIYIENKGNGRVFDITQRSDDKGVLKCNPYSEEGLKYQDIDQIKLETVFLSNEDIPLKNCKPSKDGTVRLIDGKGIVICEKDVSGTSTFLTPLEIKFSYGYTSSIQKEVEILKAFE